MKGRSEPPLVSVTYLLYTEHSPGGLQGHSDLQVAEQFLCDFPNIVQGG